VVSKKRESYIFDLAETFVNMGKARLKLNPEKCIFGITKGKVLGCLVSTKASKQTTTRSGPSGRCSLRRAKKTCRNS
jgi:hypothetical protein